MGIITAILVLGVLIFVHELGHFLIAKLFNVGVLEFALGFGKPLLQWQGSETTYSIRAIPLGGFVRMAGDDPVMVYGESVVGARDEVAGASPIEGTQESLTPKQEAMLADEKRWFLKKSYLPRCAIVVAGPAFNFLFAFLLAFVSLWVAGIPHIIDGPVTIGGVLESSPAEQSGLKVGDKISSVDGKPVQSFVDLLGAVQGSQGKPLVFALERPKGDVPEQEGQAAPVDQLTITVQPSLDAASELDVVEGRPTQQTYRIGITRSLDNFTYEPATLGESVLGAWTQVTGLSMQILRSLKGLITGQISARKSIGGPIAIIKQTASSAQQGWLALVGIMIFLNITLAIMNLLPIPVLDGGHLTLFTLEQLRGRPLTMKFQAAVTNVGLVILLSLMVFAIGNDLVRALL
jgi:regulator of sigma E protease